MSGTNRRRVGGRPWLHLGAACFLGTVALGSPEAGAMPPDAEKEYEAGKAALKAGVAEAALRHFREAMGLAAGDERDTWQLLLAMALAHEALDAPGHAIETYRRFLARTEELASVLDAKWRERRRLAEESIATLEKRAMERHGYVAVASEPGGAALFVGGVRAGAEGDATTPFGVYLKPGEARIRLELPGHAPAEVTVRVEAGKLAPVKLVLVPSGGVVAEGASGEPRDGLSSTGPSSTGPASVVRRESAPSGAGLGPWLLAGAGVLTAGSGILFTMRAAEAESELDRLSAKDDPYPTKPEWDAAREDMESNELISWTLYSVGAVLVAGGATWLLFGGGGGDEPAVHLHLAPGRGGRVQAGVLGRF